MYYQNYFDFNRIKLKSMKFVFGFKKKIIFFVERK